MFWRLCVSAYRVLRLTIVADVTQLLGNPDQTFCQTWSQVGTSYRQISQDGTTINRILLMASSRLIHICQRCSHYAAYSTRWWKSKGTWCWWSCLNGLDLRKCHRDTHPWLGCRGMDSPSLAHAWKVKLISCWWPGYSKAPPTANQKARAGYCAGSQIHIRCCAWYFVFVATLPSHISVLGNITIIERSPYS